MDFNTVANHPEVRPYLGGSGELDLAPLIDKSFTFQNEHGGFVVHPILPCIYEVHSLFLPEGKGTAYELAVSSIRAMFAGTDCARLVTKVPDNNEAAAHLARKVGFREEFRREKVEMFDCGVSYQTITVERWRDSDPDCLAAGEWFHKRIEQERHGKLAHLPEHPDEGEAHDRAAGACVLMCRAGQPEKGAAFYNMWAAFAGFPPVTVLESGALDIGSGVVVRIRGDDFEVVECR